MTEEETYAAAQREAVRPFECSLSPECWVTHGGRATLNPMSLSKTPRCLACDGKLQLAFWKTPKDLKLPPHGRLLTRSHSRGPTATSG